MKLSVVYQSNANAMRIKRSKLRRPMQRGVMRYILVCLLSIAFVFTCTTVVANEYKDRFAKIKKDETTRADIHKWFGNPDRVTYQIDGTVTYTYLLMRANTKPQFLDVKFGLTNLVISFFSKVITSESNMPEMEENSQTKK